MKKTWEAPLVRNIKLGDTANSDQDPGAPDGVFLGWLDRDGTDCTICS